MITVTATSAFMGYLTWTALGSSNPIKMSLSILMTAIIMFGMAKIQTGSSWFPLIYLMLFTGGIMMMFMTLSSVLPNEKVLSMKIPLAFILALMVTQNLPSSPKPTENISSSMKSFLTSSSGLALMTTLILIYFFISMTINSKENYPLRSLIC